MGLCPRCNEGHHSSLCLSETKRQDTGYIALPRQQGRNVQLPPAARLHQPPINRNHRQQSDARNVQSMHNSQNERQIPTLDKTPSVNNQCVLQIATAMIFSEAEWDYQPITLLLDSGAQKSFIKSGISEELKLRITGSTSFTTSGMGELQESFNSNEVQVTLKGLHSPRKLKKLSVHTKQKLTTPLTTAELSEEDLNFISSSSITVAQQSLASTTVSVDLLIGQDLLSTIIDHSSPVLTLPSGLILTPTVFGYTISGTSLTKAKTSAEVHGSALVIASPAISSREDYKQDIKNLYELESLGLKTENDPDEASIMKFMDDYRKTIQIKEGIITAGFPFNENVGKLKDNFNVAFRRLQALLRTLRDDKEKLQIYDDTFQTYIKEGIIEECAFNPTGVTAFYLPHRHVWTPGKSTELRVVFDASSHGRNELSLNDVIYEGHALTPLIHEVLLQFRTHKNTMVADIQKAFLQIRLPDHHRDATRFLWIKNLDSPAEGDNVKYYRFCRVPFGINASPAILNQSILKHIEQENSPIGKELSKSLYVDNILLEGETSDDLIRKYTASKQVFSSIGMNLRDYLSNSSTVNDSIKESDRAKDKEIKVLGLSWNSIDDTLSFSCTEKMQKKVSKRTVLSQINGFCFDPLGLLTPLIVPAKVFLQDIHKMKLGWDTPLPDEASQQWNSIRSNIIGFSKSIPRKVLEKDPEATHILSIFVDSSKRAYACSLYVTTTSEDGKVDTQLFTAKSKVAPLKKEQTIPRLELLSIFLGLSVAESTIEKSGVKFAKVNVFSDSTIALSWVHTSKKLPPTVTTLVQKIGFATERIQGSSPVMFYHVPTDENAADRATRGVTKQEFAESNWWTGPKWLNYPCETWPVTHISNLQRDTCEDVETLAVQSTEEVKADAVWPVETVSNYSKLRRIVAYSLRFIRHSSRNRHLQLLDSGVRTMTPNAAEIELAEKYIVKQEQNIHGTSAAIQNKHFNVGYDNEGILKRFGRIQHADVLKDVASPMYIPRQSILGARIAENIHRSMAHCGSNQLVCELRQRFWIPKDKALCKKTVRNCVTCKKFNSAPFSYPDMGPLPKERVTQAPPFSHTGVDYMGPIVIRLTTGEDEKRYVALYTCLVTRLVHLEVATDLSAKSFLLTFKRFVARRGVPQKIISDNGINFRLGESILSNNLHEDEDAELSLFFAEHRIAWHFIPPASPWMGGVWERMVGIVKRALHKTIGRRKLSAELLHTTLCEIEGIVNSRPLTSIGDQDSPCQFLRPVDFIYKDVRLGSTQLTPSDNDEDDPDYRTTPELSSQKEARTALSETEKLTKKFWTIWKHDYLLELRDRHQLFEKRKKSTSHDPKVGDIVLLDEESQLSRGQWPMAVILELITSRDGKIRSVILRTSTDREVQRPLNRIVPLEIRSTVDDDEEADATPTSKGGMLSKVRRILKKKPSHESVEVRKQPPRAAKKLRNYGTTSTSAVI
ncbi:hypothetical protein Y032_0040g167 [Ancylostoma ceylanicum]|uniref:Integrase catalytic domain-containing protein n=1 Tax=Ancylostoma ceylanicum TaxID=53326 RepID=A0A016UGR2_9BILA|nr:hypothetical protein Y032_0040g167 [Ancylostoma ceylanicum]